VAEFPVSALSDRAMTILSQAYEVDEATLARDVRTVFTWQGQGDDLVASLSASHHWSAETSVSYVSAVRRAMLWNLTDRGW
jgi:glycosyltransferase A (GT-A) superfamily protein (DUF2064 family)